MNLQTRFENCDSIVQKTVEGFIKRAEFGKQKYGATMDRKDLTPAQWCQHAIEEIMDMLLYISRLKADLELYQDAIQRSKEITSFEYN